MKSLKLVNLKLRNFKGIKNFDLNAGGDSLVLRGRNEVGKTTTFDAFTWLLFDRDSEGKSNFNIKTLGEDGEVLEHGIEHEVEGIFMLDGKELRLKRIYQEDWTRKRGQSEKLLTGHKNKYYIDDEPVRKTDYADRISEIITGDAFSLLTNPHHFNEQYDRKQRRDMLIEVAGSVTEDEMVEENKELESFIDQLEGRTIKSLMNILNERGKKVKDEIETIPIRIDELNKTIPAIDETKINGDEVDGKIKELSNIIKEKNEKINDIKNGSEVNKLKVKKSEIDVELSKIKNEHDKDNDNKVHKLKVKLQEIDSNTRLLNSDIEFENKIIKDNEGRIKDFENHIEDLRNQYREQNKLEFEYEGNETCPTCEQSLPSEQVEDAKNRALESFNQEKASQKETIMNSAKKYEKEINALNTAIEASEKKLEKFHNQLKLNENHVERLKEEIKEVEENIIDINDNETYKNKVNERKNIEKDIEELESSVDESVKEVEKEIEPLEEEKSSLLTDLNMIKTHDSVKARIKELMEKERELAGQLESIEKDMYLAEEYTKTQMKLLENKINSKFKMARFRLFKEHISGGISEVCDTTYKGVPYDDLNDASKINIGLDIINTLSKHFNIKVPIFIDNAESVINLVDVESQVISLRVADTDLEIDHVNDGVA